MWNLGWPDLFGTGTGAVFSAASTRYKVFLSPSRDLPSQILYSLFSELNPHYCIPVLLLLTLIPVLTLFFEVTPTMVC